MINGYYKCQAITFRDEEVGVGIAGHDLKLRRSLNFKFFFEPGHFGDGIAAVFNHEFGWMTFFDIDIFDVANHPRFHLSSDEERDGWMDLCVRAMVHDG